MLRKSISIGFVFTVCFCAVSFINSANASNTNDINAEEYYINEIHVEPLNLNTIESPVEETVSDVYIEIEPEIEEQTEQESLEEIEETETIEETEEVEESYTSGISSIDKEEINKENYNKTRRIKRGLFKTETGKLINSDINGSLNILRKYIKSFSPNLEIAMDIGREQRPLKKRVA